FQILGDDSNTGVREKAIARADSNGTLNKDVSLEVALFADLHFVADYAIGTDIGAFGDARACCDDSCLVDHDGIRPEPSACRRWRTRPNPRLRVHLGHKPCRAS